MRIYSCTYKEEGDFPKVLTGINRDPENGEVAIQATTEVIKKRNERLYHVVLVNDVPTIEQRSQEDIDAEEAAAKALAEKVEDLDRQMKSQDFFLWQLIVAIIDVGLAKGIWVGTDFPEDLKNKYVEIKAKLEALHPSA